MRPVVPNHYDMRFITANRKSFVVLCAMGLLASLSAFNSEEDVASGERSGNSVPVNLSLIHI